MSFPVIKSAGYVLVHTPDMIVRNGTTCQVEMQTNPDSEFLKEIDSHIRSYEDVVNYMPNQVYIGNNRPEDLRGLEMPWCQHKIEGQRNGKFGEIMPQDEFLAFMQISDVFDLVKLSDEFVNEVKPKIEKNYPEMAPFLDKIKGDDIEEGKELLERHVAEGLYQNDKLVGYVKAAHDVDINLSAHTMFENLVVKASGVLAGLQMLRHSGVDPESIDYVIECSEEACGDMNQRGGGNFAKSIAEIVGLKNATGSDTRGFCAAPTHALINASALVKSGVYKSVLIVAGGASAKLGMNAKDHVKKGLPVLEDVLGGFAVLITENDGVSPVVRTDLTGKHTVGTGSAPQAVMTSLITTALDKGGLKITDVDVYSVEMQNPDITKPAGAGDVPESNYKMIGALGVKRGDLEKKELKTFVSEKGLPGWAPTQGHIPSGIPYAGFAIDDMTTGDVNRAMIVGKGSLFLGRMTNLFDGVSVIVERNSGVVEEPANTGVSSDEIKKVLADAIRKLAQGISEE
ncbi:MAG: ketoacyl-ACP synthase III family protein [Clostridioides sp.]|jgi:betaine reductase|nr:ketoacyl-ACP synthase III family protein [Clostridioides sp.]